MSDEPGRHPPADPPAAPSEPGKALPFVVALLIGFAGVPLVAYYIHWHEAVVLRSLLHTTFMSLTPIAFFLVFLLVALVNPLLRRFLPAAALGRRELVIVFALWSLTAVVCYTHLAGPALFSAGNVNSRALETLTSREAGITSYLKRSLFLAPAEAQEYNQGKSDGFRRIPVTRVPWRLWLRPLAFWLPLLAVVAIFSSSLVRVCHRQWSKHELLPYPLGDVADGLVRPGDGRLFPRAFYAGGFWWGFLLITLMYVVNGLRTWFPNMVEIPTSYWHKELIANFPFLEKYCGQQATSLFRGIIYPFLVCIAVLLPTDISLTCWLGWVLMVLATGVYFLFTGQVIGPAETNHFQSGTYVAMCAMILVIGWREYLRIGSWAFRWRRPDDAGLCGAVTACRVFLASCAALVLLLVFAGIDWLLACLLVLGLSLNVILIARVTAEFGITWLINFEGKGTALPVQLLGPAAVGPKGLALLATVAFVLDYDPRNSIAAQQTIVSKLVEDDTARGHTWRRNSVLAAGLCAALAAAVFFTLWHNYSFGARQEEPHQVGLSDRIGKASDDIGRLAAEGQLERLKSSGVFGRLAWARAESGFWRFFLYGGLVVILCALMRLRFTWWPFHPLVFIFFGTFGMGRLYPSFFLGWAIKTAIVRVGGGKVYMRAKPFFLGMILGQIMIAGFWVLVGDAYYLIYKAPPPVVRFIM